MFKSLFTPKVKESKKIVLNGEILVGKKDRNGKEIQVTKILLPEKSLKLDKDSKIVLTQLEDDRIVLVKLIPEIKGSKDAEFAAQYNIGDNSINSSKFAEKLKDLFIIDEEEFKLEANLEVVSGVEILTLSRITESSIEDKSFGNIAGINNFSE